MISSKTKKILLSLSLVLLLATVGLTVGSWRQRANINLRDIVLTQDTTESPTDSQDTATDEASPDDVKGEYTVSDVSKVKKVIDGDTIELESGQKVRLIGVDTPETVDPRRPVGCFGKEASNFTKQLLNGKKVRLEKDISETDKFGRLLRYVYVLTDQGEVFVNDTLARQGYAMVKTYPPDVKYQEQFLQAQQEARENNRGLWASCK